MKFGQLIKYNMRNISLKNHTQNVGEKESETLFLKLEIELIAGSTIWNFVHFLFIVCPSRGLLKYIKTKKLTSGFYLIPSRHLSVQS